MEEEYKKCRQLVREFFKGEPYKVDWWFTTKNILLGGLKPNDLIETGRTQKLLAFIENSIEENKR